MKPVQLGTIIPSKKQLVADGIERDRFAKIMELKGDKLLGSYQKRTVGGEVRYYDGESFYAVYSARFAEVKWFAVKPDGDYVIANYKAGKIAG